MASLETQDHRRWKRRSGKVWDSQPDILMTRRWPCKGGCNESTRPEGRSVGRAHKDVRGLVGVSRAGMLSSARSSSVSSPLGPVMTTTQNFTFPRHPQSHTQSETLIRYPQKPMVNSSVSSISQGSKKNPFHSPVTPLSI